MDLKKRWNAKLREAVPRALAQLRKHEAFTGFVANVDAVKFVDGKTVTKLLSSLPADEVRKRLEAKSTPSVASKEDFAAALLYCFENGKALELPCHDARIFEWFSDYFAGFDELRMGGQASIIANQLAALGMRPVCYCTMLSPGLAKLFDKKVKFPVNAKNKLKLVPAIRAARKTDPTKTNWIFEFRKGDALEWDGRTLKCPRSNRLIILSKLVRYEPVFPPKLEPHLPEIGRRVDRAMVAGFHHLHKDMRGGVEGYLARLCRQLDSLKEANASLKVHIEYVMITDSALAKLVYSRVGRPADSLGINEVEAHHVLKLFGFDRELEELRKEESAFNLYNAAGALARRFDFSRVHVHTLGYYVLYMEKKNAGESVRGCVDSLLLAAKASEVRAALGRPPTKKELLDKKFDRISVSDAGLEQMKKFADDAGLNGKERKRLLEEGIAEFADHYVFVTPCPITSKPKSTVGLGDTISATAFCSQP